MKSPSSSRHTHQQASYFTEIATMRISRKTTKHDLITSYAIVRYLSCSLLLLVAMAGEVDAQASDSVESNATPKLIVTPNQGELTSSLDCIQLVVTDNASQRGGDLTRSVSYESLTPDIISVSDTGFVRPLADGEGVIRVTDQQRATEVSFKVSVSGPASSANFLRDVIPILSRSGCSGGSCHASQYGKAGFKLSLWGFDPQQDYEPLARDQMQRRISLVRPEDSLILLKATLKVSHGGGRRFDEDSYDYQVLKAWLLDGAPGPIKDQPTVVGLTVTPRERDYRVGDGQQLRIVAQYSDGTDRDVTHAAIYDSMSDAVASVSPSGYVTAVGSGQTSVMVRYSGQAKVSMVLTPFRDKVDLSGFEPNNFVDELVMRRWSRLGLEPSSLCDDAEFIRRVFLDTIGTLPKPEQVNAFVASTDANKRDTLIDELLGLTGDPQRDIYVNEWSAYWSLKWGDLIRNNRNKLGDGGMWALYNWMRDSFRHNKPFDLLVRELITAEGSVFESGPANYYRIATKPEDLAEATAQIFLGVRMQCAKCHHHPFEAYSQADYYGLAAFFTRVSSKASTDFGALGGDSVVMVKRSGSIRHPRTRKPVPPTPLLGQAIDPDQHRDLRRPLAQWLTSPDNRLFAHNIVNRFWGYLMGTGLVESIDDMRATNPPSNPALLEALADDFVKNKFDLRQLMRLILTSRTYQLSSYPTVANSADTRFYTHYNVKRLPAEVLLDAIDSVCGTREKFSGIPAGARAIELPDPNYASYFLDTMGRPSRVVACECERTNSPNLAQVLHIANGDLLQRKISDKNGRIATLLKAEKTDEEIIAQLFLLAFSRHATEEEVAKCTQVIAAAENRTEGLEDVLWALCNSREFLFVH